jgi:hypothetical protein
MGPMGIGEFARLSRLSPKALRQIGVPLAQIKVVLGMDAPTAAGQVAAWWTGAEAQHAAGRELASYLIDRLNGKSLVIHEVAVRDIPAACSPCCATSTPMSRSPADAQRGRAQP